MRDLIDLSAFWHHHADSELSFCTLVGKKGSGYRAPGAKKIIARSGESCGLLSGGCLENDIARTAIDEWPRMPFVKSFSTMGNKDLVLGYQVGCAGVIDVLFEHLPGPGADSALWLPFGSPRRAAGVHVSLESETLARRALGDRPQQRIAGFFDRWVEPIELVLIGCGPDAQAFNGLATHMGWKTRFFDYRERHADGIDLSILPLDLIAEAVPRGRHVALVLMTHNYQADLALLASLAGQEFGYLGCLGPRVRFDRMLDEIKASCGTDMPDTILKHIYAPAGLLPKQHDPASIALSVIAQIQSVLGGDNCA